MKMSLVKAKSKHRAPGSKPRSRQAKPANARARSVKKGERGALSSKALPAAAFLLAGAVLAMLVAFHSTHKRLHPQAPAATAALHDVSLGR